MLDEENFDENQSGTFMKMAHDIEAGFFVSPDDDLAGVDIFSVPPPPLPFGWDRPRNLRIIKILYSPDIRYADWVTDDDLRADEEIRQLVNHDLAELAKVTRQNNTSLITYWNNEINKLQLKFIKRYLKKESSLLAAELDQESIADPGIPPRKLTEEEQDILGWRKTTFAQPPPPSSSPPPPKRVNIHEPPPPPIIDEEETIPPIRISAKKRPPSAPAHVSSPSSSSDDESQPKDDSPPPRPASGRGKQMFLGHGKYGAKGPPYLTPSVSHIEPDQLPSPESYWLATPITDGQLREIHGQPALIPLNIFPHGDPAKLVAWRGAIARFRTSLTATRVDDRVATKYLSIASRQGRQDHLITRPPRDGSFEIIPAIEFQARHVDTRTIVAIVALRNRDDYVIAFALYPSERFIVLVKCGSYKSRSGFCPVIENFDGWLDGDKLTHVFVMPLDQCNPVSLLKIPVADTSIQVIDVPQAVVAESHEVVKVGGGGRGNFEAFDPGVENDKPPKNERSEEIETFLEILAPLPPMKIDGDNALRFMHLINGVYVLFHDMVVLVFQGYKINSLLEIRKPYRQFLKTVSLDQRDAQIGPSIIGWMLQFLGDFPSLRKLQDFEHPDEKSLLEIVQGTYLTMSRITQNPEDDWTVGWSVKVSVAYPKVEFETPNTLAKLKIDSLTVCGCCEYEDYGLITVMLNYGQFMACPFFGLVAHIRDMYLRVQHIDPKQIRRRFVCRRAVFPLVKQD
jgi:hypothetical protein